MGKLCADVGSFSPKDPNIPPDNWILYTEPDFSSVVYGLKAAALLEMQNLWPETTKWESTF